MSITRERKTELIQEFRRDEADTGSAELQVAVLTERIKNLTVHLKSHVEDHGSRVATPARQRLRRRCRPRLQVRAILLDTTREMLILATQLIQTND